ncbi:TPA: hypothetical protein N0F65_004489 [Lagenidium giganteum]|uniref:Uncharacterized protein n=1 Tax=Lagenidium giganteum TaxID=4803 RepID=A0AAV2ZDT2_9STRA|nr:TPA: hypothetical protein N0F65_004489 [Lagenidium giganteum]
MFGVLQRMYKTQWIWWVGNTGNDDSSSSSSTKKGGAKATGASMFSARKYDVPPSKRGGSGMGSRYLQDMKRQRLEHMQKLSLPTPQPLEDAPRVLTETPECVITTGASVPAYVMDELRKKKLHVDARKAAQTMVLCKAHGSAVHQLRRSPREYFVFVLPGKLLLWHESQAGKVLTLPLPDSVDDQDVLHPFLFAIYGHHLSLMVVGQSGLVLFWEDIELPYESIPLSVQIPLQAQEHVQVNADSIVSLQQAGEELLSLLCWSNCGNVWEVAMEDRRIRIRAFEKQIDGFFSGITRSVSQFFFSSGRAAPSADVDLQQPIRQVKVLPSVNMDDGDSMNMLVLFESGMFERRAFSVVDVVDCSCTTSWQLDANRVAIAYFSENFPDHHLAKVSMMSVPYIYEDCFALLVAYVCSSRSEGHAKVKYALFQFSFLSAEEVPEPEWACILDYEPLFSEIEEPDRYFTAQSFVISRRALYVVWTLADPLPFSSVVLPRSNNSSARSVTFSLQGVQKHLAVAFGSRITESPHTANALMGSVAFVLVGGEKDLNGALCCATATNMLSIEPSRLVIPEPQKKKLQESTSLAARDTLRVPAGLSVQDYTQLLMKYFHEDPYSSHPFVVGENDFRNLSQAVVAVDYQILDAKPSSGLRWGRDDDMNGSPDAYDGGSEVALVTPKLVRFQLEEKSSRHNDFMQFLERRFDSVWHYMSKSGELLHHLVEDEEKLNAAIALSKFQGSLLASHTDIKRKLSGELLLNAIERTVENRGYQKEELRLAGYNAFDIFYCEVSKITELFYFLNAEVKRVSSSSGETSSTYLYALLESGYSMLNILRAASTSSLAPPADRSHSWIFTRQIREIVLDQISRLSVLTGYSSNREDLEIKWAYEDVFEIAEQIASLGTNLLDMFGRFLPQVTGAHAEDMKKETDMSKRIIINPLVYLATTFEPDTAQYLQLDFEGDQSPAERKRSELFEYCVELSERYEYSEAMVYLAYAEDLENLQKLDYVLGRAEMSSAARRLESYCDKFAGFGELDFRWYAGDVPNPWIAHDESVRAKMMAYLMANTKLLGSQLHQYVRQHGQLTSFAWVTSISRERYDQTAALALHQSLNEHGSLTRRKTLASVAKIAALAGPPTSRTGETAIEARKELSRIKIQEVLRRFPIQSTIDDRPLTSDALVEACLNALSQVQTDDSMRTSIFVMGLEALENGAFGPRSPEFDSLLNRVWRRCIVEDRALWQTLLGEYSDSVNEESMEAKMRQTLLYSGMKKYLARPTRESPAALTIEVIDELVQQEASNDSVIGVHARQLFVKTLNLALAC